MYKIKLFQESELILSTTGSQGTFMLYSNTDCTYIEMRNKGETGPWNGQTEEICNVLNRKYKKYSNIKEDRDGNFNLNVTEFEKYLILLFNQTVV